MKKSYCFLFILLSTFSFATTSISQSKSDKINTLMSTFAEYEKFNGSVLVAEEGKIIYKKGFGLANMEWDIPNQTNTKFRLASVSKQFTAMLTMQLVAEGKLSLEEPISTYLPDYPKEQADKINIHHLLTHSSGIPSYTGFHNYRELMRQSMPPNELVKLFADSTLQFTPGERFNYSNSGYALLGVIIEKITNQSFKDVLQEKILSPLQMNNTGYDNSRDILKNRAIGYHKNGIHFVHSNYIDMSVAYTAGGLYSTVEDMFLWDQALYNEKLLPKKYMDLIFKKQIAAWGQHYGYGWIIGNNRVGNNDEFIPSIEHDGSINGFGALILRLPSNQSTVILLNNTGTVPFYKITEGIIGILNDKTYDFPKKPFARSFSKIIKKEGIQKGLSFYEQIKDSDEYDISENDINLMGYDFLQSGKLEVAKAIFKLNISAFPKSSNAYDSYAEALMNLGSKEESIKYYKKSLRLNPDNENAIHMLEKLGISIKKEDLYLLTIPENWGTEIFIFPLNFAKDLAYEGIEEAHFPRGWRDTESSEFWSYAFAWDINLNSNYNSQQLEVDVQKYFDGLTNVVNKNKDFTLPKTIAQFKQKEDKNGNSYFTGTIEIFDTFVTNEKMTLHVQVEQQYCKQQKKSILLFRFSPKAFGHEIWTDLESIVFFGDTCGK